MHPDQFAEIEKNYQALDEIEASGNVLMDDDIDFDKYLKATDTAEKVKSVRDFIAPVMHILSPKEESPKSIKLPFRDAWFYFNPGEVTIWAGYNGAGKSAIQGQVIAEFASKGDKSCIASMEMKPARTLARICKQRSEKKEVSFEEVTQILTSLHETLWAYDQQGSVDKKRIIAVIKHCAEKLKCKHIAIDSLMKCIRGTEDYDGQKDFVNELTVVARDLNIHIHLVAHLKKPLDGSNKIPTRYDIKGAAEISDLADNVIIVWRNEKKEALRDSGKPVDDKADSDSILIIDKVRNGDWQGRVPLWFDRSSMKFYDFYKPRGIF